MDKKMQDNMKNMPPMNVKDTCRQAEENTRRDHGDKMPKGK